MTSFFRTLFCGTWLLPWLVFVLLAGSALWQTSITYDEPVYIVGGLSYLTTGQFTINDCAPPLVSYLAGAVAYACGDRLPGGRVPFKDSLYNEWPFSEKVLFKLYPQGDRVDDLACCFILIPFSLLLFASIWGWARALGSRASAPAAVWLAAGSPSLLALCGVVSDDFACAVSWVALSLGLYRFLKNPALGSGLALGFLTGLALACKFTSLLLLPVIGTALAGQVWMARTGWRQATIRYGLAACTVAMAMMALLYGWPPHPENYWIGLTHIYRNMDPDLKTYIFGAFFKKPPFYYFPCAIFLKESVILVLSGAAGALLLLRLPDRLARFCLLAPVLVLMTAVLFDHYGLGVRRVLPAVAFLPVFSAVAWKRLAPRLARPLLLGALAVGCNLALMLVAWPNYISYFNPVARLFGSPLFLLSDSNLDWGQDLKALKTILDQKGIRDGYICYNGGVDPRDYGITLKPLSMNEILKQRPPGVYAVSALYLIYLISCDPQIFPPDTFVGCAGESIYLFKR